MCRTSFLIPVRDGEATLPAALASVLAQDDPDFEVVVVDDGSADRSAELALSTGDPRVRLVRGLRAGIAPALNLGLAHCRGVYIARMDADDLADPRRLSLQLPRFDDPALAVVDGQVAFFRDDGPVPGGMDRYGAWVNAARTADDIARALWFESPIVHPAATVRADALRAVGGYRHGDFPEDLDLWLRLHLAGHRFAKVADVVVRMRDRPERLTRTDPRYRADAFRSLRQQHLLVGPLARRPRVLLVGGGKRSRPWLRFLLESGVPVVAIADVTGPGPPRRGVPVVGIDRLSAVDAELALVAVGDPAQHGPIGQLLSCPWLAV